MTFTAVVKVFQAFSAALLGKAAYQPLIALAIFLEDFLEEVGGSPLEILHSRVEPKGLFYIEPGSQPLCYGMFSHLVISFDF